jgi:hypothetical protein
VRELLDDVSLAGGTGTAGEPVEVVTAALDLTGTPGTVGAAGVGTPGCLAANVGSRAPERLSRETAVAGVGTLTFGPLTNPWTGVGSARRCAPCIDWLLGELAKSRGVIADATGRRTDAAGAFGVSMI